MKTRKNNARLKDDSIVRQDLNTGWLTTDLRLRHISTFIKEYKLLHTRFVISIFAICFLTFNSFAQNISINTTGAAAANCAILDVSSSSLGLLIPRVALTNVTTYLPLTGTAVDGLMVYSTAAPTGGNGTGYYYWSTSSSIWVSLVDNLAPGKPWIVGGNTETGAAGTSYIMGELGNHHIDFYTNGLVRGRYSNLGEFFVGTTATAMSGDLMNGVANTSFPWALNGYSDQAGSGVYGSITAGASAYSAIEGSYNGTGAGCGILGGNSGSGAGSGIAGQYLGSNAGTQLIGVKGYSDPTVAGSARIGVYGSYNGAAHYGIGVIGIGYGGGVPAGNLDIAVVGWRANNANYSGYYNGNHVIANGTKSASVGTSKGNQLLYAMESPEVWFEDFGSGQLVNGFAKISLDELFLETTVIDKAHPFRVFIQLEGDCNGVYITNKTPNGFDVIELNNGNSNVEFSYRIVAKRLNFQDHRFGNDPVWGPGDTKQYMQYATPPPVDYYENIKFQELQKKNWKPTPLPKTIELYVPSENLIKKSSGKNPPNY